MSCDQRQPVGEGSAPHHDSQLHNFCIACSLCHSPSEMCHPEPVRLRSGQAPPRDPGSFSTPADAPPITDQPRRMPLDLHSGVRVIQICFLCHPERSRGTPDLSRRQPTHPHPRINRGAWHPTCIRHFLEPAFPSRLKHHGHRPMVFNTFKLLKAGR